MTLAHAIMGLLQLLLSGFFVFTSVDCPRCYVELHRLPKPNEGDLFRCPSCDGLWVRRDKRLHPFITGPG